MSAPRWAEEGRDWPLADHSRFVSAAGLQWHVQRFGSGPVALLLHGTGAATHSWRDLAPLLARHFTVLSLDLPGHGFTQGRLSGGMRLPVVARAVAELLGREDAAPALTIGHSAGVAIAVQMALAGSPAPITGFNPALTPFPGIAARIFPTMAKLLFANPFVAHMCAAIAARPGEVERFLKRATGSRIDAAGVEYYRRLFATSRHCDGALGMMADWDLEALSERFAEVSVPVLLVHGEHDAAVPRDAAERAAAAIPGAVLEIMPAAGHLAHEERPREAADRILRFARDHAILAADGQG